MTNYELAVALVRLGAKHGDGARHGARGGDGLRRHAADAADRAAEQPISDALLLSYNGVYAAPPSSDDALAERRRQSTTSQTFSYKLVRPSQVTAVGRRPGPDDDHRSRRTPSSPAMHTLQWDGSGAVEGSWRFSSRRRTTRAARRRADRHVRAQPDARSAPGRRGRATGPDGVPSSSRIPRPSRSPSRSRTGSSSRRSLSKKLDSGPQSVTWTGRTRHGYRVRVVASNSIGKATLLSPSRRAARRLHPVLASISSSLTSQVAAHGAYAVFVLMAIDAVFPRGERARDALCRRRRGRCVRSAHHVSVFGAKIGFGIGAFVVMAPRRDARLPRRRAHRLVDRPARRPALLERRGRWLHVTPESLDRAERWFERWGNVGVLSAG